MSVLSASTMTGDSVKNLAGESLGEIGEIMLDVEAGRIRYAVIDFGGFLGIGNKLFAVPWEALSLDKDAKTFILDVEKETLENSEGFDQDDWPDFANEEWNRNTYSTYGYDPYW